MSTGWSWYSLPIVRLASWFNPKTIHKEEKKEEKKKKRQKDKNYNSPRGGGKSDLDNRQKRHYPYFA